MNVYNSGIMWDEMGECRPLFFLRLTSPSHIFAGWAIQGATVFLGEYSHTLDDKGRLTIPARLREDLENGLVITRGDDPCLVIHPTQQFLELASKVAQMPAASRSTRDFRRRVFGGAHEASLDKLGRVLVPAFLREYAGIQDQALIVGANTAIEVWSPERYQQALAREEEHRDETLIEMASRGV
jgi:MraZ protein